MRRLSAIQSTASAMQGQRALLIMVGLLFAVALTACEAALADDGIASKGDAIANSDAQANLSRQVSNEDRLTVADIDPDQLYEWVGLVEWTDLEGGHFVINRGCDRWSLAVESDESYARLKELMDSRATVWGSVSDASIYGRRTIDVKSVYGPNDPRPAIALPHVPCPDAPVPADVMRLNQSEITLHGDLVWRGGRLWLVTDRGTVALRLPDPAMVAIPDQAAPADGDENNDVPFSLGEYGVAGTWGLSNTGLVIEVRDIQEWPFRNVAFDSCGNGKHVFGVSDNQLAVNGWIVRDGAQWILRTESGKIFVHPGFNADDLDSARERTDADLVAPDVANRAHQVVVIGEWKTDGSELHMEAERFIRIKTECEPPEPPRPPILPGEIAALGTLVFENGRPYLNTPQGRIVLLTVNDANDEPQPVPGDVLDGLLDGEADIAQDVPQTEDDVVRDVRYILVVGKWQVTANGQLAIVVRYARPWPYPYTVNVEPMPIPETGMPSLPPTDGIPVDPTLGGEVVMPDGSVVGVTGVSIESIEADPELVERTRANAK